MLNGIGAAAQYAYPAANGQGSTGVLETQLARYEIQLADWNCCPDGKTPEGKQKIQDLTNRIGDIKTRLKAADGAGGVGPDVAPKAPERAASDSRVAPGPGSTLGRHVDVYV